MASQHLSRTSEDLHRIKKTVLPERVPWDSRDWPSTAGEERTHKDKNAVAVYEEDSIIGHVPFTLPLSILGKR